MRRVKVLSVLGAAVTSAGWVAGCAQPKAGPQAVAFSRGRESGIRFVEATETAGIRFKHHHGGFGKKLMPETIGSGCAWVDVDGDEWQDLVLVNCTPLPGGPPGEKPTAALYRNRGDGTFQDITAGSGLDVSLYGQGVSAADYDGDGDQDLFISCLGPNRLFRNNGKGRFTEVAKEAGVAGSGEPWEWHSGSAWLDYDRDGRLDLFVARYVRWSPETDQFCGVPGELKRYCPPWKYPNERCRLYRNLGSGRFRDVSREKGIDQVAGKWFQPLVLDYDRDGWPDIAVSSDGTQTALFRNEEGKRFRDLGAEMGLGLAEGGIPKAGMGIDAADWRNQGRESVLIGNFSGQKLSLFEPDSDRIYAEVTEKVGMGQSSLYSLTFGLAFLDADLDGWRDAFIGNGHIDDFIERFEANVTYAQRPLFYHNQKNGQFTELGSQAGPAFEQKWVVRGCAVADYDRDGDPDLVVVENNRGAHLLRNESRPAGNWLRLVLRGPKGNPTGVGARVQVIAGSTTQEQTVRAGGLFLSQSEPVLHFGTATADPVRVRVTWPHGESTEHAHLSTNRSHTLTPNP